MGKRTQIKSDRILWNITSLENTTSNHAVACHAVLQLGSPCQTLVRYQHRFNSALYTVHLDALHFFLGRPTLKATRPPGFLRPASWNLHSRDKLHLNLGFWRLHSHPDNWAEALQHHYFTCEGTAREDNRGKGHFPQTKQKAVWALQFYCSVLTLSLRCHKQNTR